MADWVSLSGATRESIEINLFFIILGRLNEKARINNSMSIYEYLRPWIMWPMWLIKLHEGPHTRGPQQKSECAELWFQLKRINLQKSATSRDSAAGVNFLWKRAGSRGKSFFVKVLKICSTHVGIASEKKLIICTATTMSEHASRRSMNCLLLQSSCEWKKWLLP